MTEFQIRTYAICKSDLFYDISGFRRSIVEVFDILGTCAFVDWYLVADILGQPIGPILKGLATPRNMSKYFFIVAPCLLIYVDISHQTNALLLT